MTTIDFLNILSSGSSLVLAIVSIGMSVYFYTQSKNTEKSAAEALASIKSQTDTLQKLTGRWMDRLTRYATEGSPVNEHMIHILTAIREVPVTVAKSIQLPSNQDQIDNLTKEAISGYIGILYYSSLTNIFAQINLPPLEVFDESNHVHKITKKAVDQSNGDVIFILGILEKITAGHLNESPLKHLYDEALALWVPHVRDSTSAYADRQKG